MNTDAEDHFSGSYPIADVHFLLRPVRVTPLPVQEKERRLLSEGAHYAEMLAEETLPDVRWRELVETALTSHATAMAERHRRLADEIATRVAGEIVLVSLARAGTPTGVVLSRLLRRSGRTVYHFSVSIVLRRGIDESALDYIRARHHDSAIVFVDGWTGKGTIAAELRDSLARYRMSRGSGPEPRLAVLCDLAEVADLRADCSDALIPQALLGAVGSGLISRTLLSASLVRPGDFHACRFYGEWRSHDLSGMLVDRMTADALTMPMRTRSDHVAEPEAPKRRLADWLRTCDFAVSAAEVKPGVCESLRALMRRSPRVLVLQRADDIDMEPLRLLAQRRDIPVRCDPSLPYRSATIIRGHAG